MFFTRESKFIARDVVSSSNTLIAGTTSSQIYIPPLSASASPSGVSTSTSHNESPLYPSSINQTLLDSLLYALNNVTLAPGAEKQPDNKPFPIGFRITNTILAVLSVIIIIATYVKLIRSDSRLSTKIKISFKPTQENIKQILERAWPDDFSDVSFKGNNPRLDSPFFYLGQMDWDASQNIRMARTVNQCAVSISELEISDNTQWLISGTDLTSSSIQIVVWQWWSVLLLIFIWVETSIFNFLSVLPSPTSYSRLALNLTYSALYLFQAFHLWLACRELMTLMIADASWSVLNKANFSIVRLEDITASIKPLDYKILDLGLVKKRIVQKGN